MARKTSAKRAIAKTAKEEAPVPVKAEVLPALSGAFLAPSDADGPITVELACEKLAPFLATHPYSAVELFDTTKGKRVVVARPWGDESIALFLVSERVLETVAVALNKIYLPERFTAIWHKESKDFEVIWTAHPLPPSIADAKDRKFTFRFRDHEYICEFGKSSRAVLTIELLPVSWTPR